MSGRVAGKVALVTGAARGQGRAHAVRLAEEGADIIAVDHCSASPLVAYDASTEDDLQETVDLVKKTGQRIVSSRVDVRDLEGLKSSVEAGLAGFGRLDVVVANAGIQARARPIWEMTPEQWELVVGTNLTGVWNTIKAAVRPMIDGGRGGSIILISSTAGIKGFANLSDYTASKTGVVGLMRSMVNELGPYGIRVNTIHPTSVDTPMFHSPELYELFLPESPTRTKEEYGAKFASMHAIPVGWTDCIDQANGALYLASDEARYVTGVELKIDAGFCCH